EHSPTKYSFFQMKKTMLIPTKNYFVTGQISNQFLRKAVILVISDTPLMYMGIWKSDSAFDLYFKCIGGNYELRYMS
ncbi:MAG: hypothetical protein IJI14_03865, partial [Anaerolineaceae bacterium]|nr:hypothetical protein [Anaerolineaceae bacterium]